jgi:hypothetical protein
MFRPRMQGRSQGSPSPTTQTHEDKRPLRLDAILRGRSLIERHLLVSGTGTQFVSGLFATGLSLAVLLRRADDVEHSSDHFPVRTVFDIETPIRVQEKRRNWNIPMSVPMGLTSRSLIERHLLVSGTGTQFVSGLFAKEGLQARDLSQTDPTQIECQCQTLVDVVQSAIDSFLLRASEYRIQS